MTLTLAKGRCCSASRPGRERVGDYVTLSKDKCKSSMVHLLLFFFLFGEREEREKYEIQNVMRKLSRFSNISSGRHSISSIISI